jgi:hypothetical protein
MNDEQIIKEAVEVVDALMDKIEELAPEYYSGSDLILRADDFLKLAEARKAV